jgi:hypothetical protein
MQGCRARLSGKVIGRGCRAYLHAMVQYAEIGQKCSILSKFAPRTTTTTKKVINYFTRLKYVYLVLTRE